MRLGEWVGLVWNERRKDGEPFLEAYERALDAYGTDYAEAGHRGKDAEIVAFFGEGGFETRAFENAQGLDLQRLKGRALSSSYVPEIGEAGHKEMIEDLERIFREHQDAGKVVLRYDTRVYFGRLGF
ncbi:MAG: hypothetical protein ACR2JR_07245 [Rubrobacteraceae bacterium]